MKKTILTAMLFFAFIVLGIQNANAQYVNTTQAEQLLSTEMVSVADNPIYKERQTLNSQYLYLVTKYDFYTVVYESIVLGGTVENSIQTGLTEVTGVGADHQGQVGDLDLSPLHQEIEDLLAQ